MGDPGNYKDSRLRSVHLALTVLEDPAHEMPPCTDVKMGNEEKDFPSVLPSGSEEHEVLSFGSI